MSARVVVERVAYSSDWVMELRAVTSDSDGRGEYRLEAWEVAAVGRGLMDGQEEVFFRAPTHMFDEDAYTWAVAVLLDMA